MNSDERLLQILEESRCLSKNQLLDFISHRLYPEELRAVEMHLASCELCHLALEGLSNIQDPAGLIHSLQAPLLPDLSTVETVKIKAKEEKHQPVQASVKKASEPIQNNQNKKSLYKNILGAAVILIIGGGLIWWFEIKDDHYPFGDKTGWKREEVTPASSTIIASEPSVKLIPKEAEQNVEKEENKRDLVSPASLSEDQKKEAITANKTTEKDESSKQEAAKTPSVAIGPQELNLPSRETAATSQSAKEKKEEKISASAENNKKEEKAEKTIAAKAEIPKEKVQPIKETPEKKEVEKSNNSSSDYEIGVALFKKKQYSSALIYLNSIESEKDNPHYWDALYYAALCNKNLNNKAKAKKQLKQIIKAGGPQKSAAEQQLSDLN